jgi:hypothetical protein
MATRSPKDIPASPGGFDFQHPAERLVSQRVEESVKTGLHVPNALLQRSEENLAADRLALRVELHALDVLPRVGAHRPDKCVSLPRRKRVAVVDRQTRDGGRRHPENERLLETGPGETFSDDGAATKS